MLPNWKRRGFQDVFISLREYKTCTFSKRQLVRRAVLKTVTRDKLEISDLPVDLDTSKWISTHVWADRQMQSY